MRRPDLSTPLPLLTLGEPGCPDLASITRGARRALLSAAIGPSLRRAGSGWYGPDKREPISQAAVRSLTKRGLLFNPSGNTARLTKRGHWCARTLCTETAGLSYTVEINGISHIIGGAHT